MATIDELIKTGLRPGEEILAGAEGSTGTQHPYTFVALAYLGSMRAVVISGETIKEAGPGNPYAWNETTRELRALTNKEHDGGALPDGDIFVRTIHAGYTLFDRSPRS